MDFYHEQHSYHVQLAQNANEDSDSDGQSSWVMLSRDGDIVQLPNENIFYKKRSRISLELATPSVLKNAPAFSAKSDSGTVYITTRRVIYLPTNPTETFKSFSAPVLNFEDTYCGSSSFFSPWHWGGLVKPVAGGNIPQGIPRLEIKLIFKDGGHDAFREAFETMKGRLHYAREVQAETGQTINVDEQLPQYEAAAPIPDQPIAGNRNPAPTAATAPASASHLQAAGATFASPAPAPATAQAPTRVTTSQDSGPGSGPGNQPVPDEPPPGYEEVQAQAVGAQLEDRLREEAERS